jgi:hypothetical protein
MHNSCILFYSVAVENVDRIRVENLSYYLYIEGQELPISVVKTNHSQNTTEKKLLRDSMDAITCFRSRS